LIIDLLSSLVASKSQPVFVSPILLSYQILAKHQEQPPKTPPKTNPSAKFQNVITSLIFGSFQEFYSF